MEGTHLRPAAKAKKEIKKMIYKTTFLMCSKLLLIPSGKLLKVIKETLAAHMGKVHFKNEKKTIITSHLTHSDKVKSNWPLV